MIFGLLMITVFPAKEYQKSAMTTTGVWIGIVIFIIGLVAVVFG